MPQLNEVIEKRKNKKGREKKLPPLGYGWEYRKTKSILEDSEIKETGERTTELDNIIGNNKVTTKGTIREQLGNNIDPTSLQNRIAKLSGIQQKILNFLVDLCSAKDTLETGPIETKMISQYINTDYGSIKTSINRLILKGFIIRKKGRTAKGGYINLLLLKEVKNIVSNQKIKQAQDENTFKLINASQASLGNNLDNNNSVSYIVVVI